MRTGKLSNAVSELRNCVSHRGKYLPSETVTDVVVGVDVVGVVVVELTV